MFELVFVVLSVVSIGHSVIDVGVPAWVSHDSSMYFPYIPSGNLTVRY